MEVEVVSTLAGGQRDWMSSRTFYFVHQLLGLKSLEVPKLEGQVLLPAGTSSTSVGGQWAPQKALQVGRRRAVRSRGFCSAIC